MRPVGPDDRPTAPRRTNVGDGPAPSADVRVLKREPGGHAAGRGQANPPRSPNARAARPEATRPEATRPEATRPKATRQSAKSQSAGLSETARPASGSAPRGQQAGSASASAGFGAALCSELRIPVDAASLAALAAMLGEGLALDPKSASAVRRLVRRHGDDPAAARLAARALGAGLDIDDAALDRALSALDPAPGYEQGLEQGSEGGSGRGPDPGSEQGRGPGDADSRDGRSDERIGSDEALVAELARSLEASVARASDDPVFAGLSVPGKDGARWVCAPFDTHFSGIRYHGFLRICYYDTVDSRTRVVVDIRSEGQRRLLEVTGAGARTRLSYHADSPVELEAFKAEFGSSYEVRVSGLVAGYSAELAAGRSVDEDA